LAQAQDQAVLARLGEMVLPGLAAEEQVETRME
jgi:hypothetical protein